MTRIPSRTYPPIHNVLALTPRLLVIRECGYSSVGKHKPRQASVSVSVPANSSIDQASPYPSRRPLLTSPHIYGCRNNRIASDFPYPFLPKISFLSIFVQGAVAMEISVPFFTVPLLPGSLMIGVVTALNKLCDLLPSGWNCDEAWRD